MAEYIEREAAKYAVSEVYYDTPDVNLSAEKFEAAINSIPAADVAPVVHGRWVGDSFCKWQCNKCHAPAPKYGYPVSEVVRSSYCPNCGTDMRGSNDE